MKIRALDNTGDWTFGRGLANYLTGAAAVGLMITTRLYMFQGDCFFDADGWIDWFNLLGSNEKAALLFSIKSIILNTPGVASVNQLTANVDHNRVISVTYSVDTIYGTPLYGQVFQVPSKPFTGVSKYWGDISFTGQQTIDVDTSLYIPDATRAVWMLYEISNGYTPVVGAVQPLDAGHVRIDLTPGGTGTYRLVGVA